MNLDILGYERCNVKVFYGGICRRSRCNLLATMLPLLPSRILFRCRPVKSDRLLLTDISCDSITSDSWAAITFLTSLFREGFNPSFMLTLVIPALACRELSFCISGSVA